MLKRASTETRERGLTGKALPFLLAAAAVLLAFQFAQLDESKRRFILHLARQAPYLPGRYYA